MLHYLIIVIDVIARLRVNKDKGKVVIGDNEPGIRVTNKVRLSSC